MDLVDFISARLDEDEQIARSTMWDGSNNVPDWHLSASATVETGGDTFNAGDRTVANHIERHDPARVLREVEAKRRIVDTYTEVDAHPNRLTYAFMQQQWVALRAVIAGLALPYADHEEFREDWRP